MEKEIYRKYWPLWILVCTLFLAWSAWGIVLQKMSPFASPEFAIPLFYGTSFLVSFLTFATFSALVQLAFFHRHTIVRITHTALRQGFFVGFITTITLLFEQFQILNIWIMLMILGMGILLELFFWSQK